MYALVDLEVLAQLELSSAEYAVLTHLMRHVNPETNQARVGLDEIADECGMLRPSVSRVMKALRDRRVVYTLRQGVHRVNPHIMFRGSNQDWDIATDLEREPIWHRT